MMLWLVNAQGKKCQVRKECLNSEVYPNIRIPILIYESCHVFLLAHIYTPKLRLMSRFRLRVSISYIKHLSPIYPRSSSRSWKFHQISYHRYYSSDQRGCPQNAFHSSPSPSLDGSPSRRNTKSTAWNQLPHRLCNQHCGIRSRFGGGGEFATNIYNEATSLVDAVQTGDTYSSMVSKANDIASAWEIGASESVT